MGQAFERVGEPWLPADAPAEAGLPRRETSRQNRGDASRSGWIRPNLRTARRHTLRGRPRWHPPAACRAAIGPRGPVRVSARAPSPPQLPPPSRRRRGHGRNAFIFALPVTLDRREGARRDRRHRGHGRDPAVPAPERSRRRPGRSDGAERPRRSAAMAMTASTALPPEARIVWPISAARGMRGRDGGGGKDRGFGHARDPTARIAELAPGPNLGYLLSQQTENPNLGPAEARQLAQHDHHSRAS